MAPRNMIKSRKEVPCRYSSTVSAASAGPSCELGLRAASLARPDHRRDQRHHRCADGGLSALNIASVRPGAAPSRSRATLTVNGHRIPLHRTPDISTLDLHHIDLVMECTGRADKAEVATRGLTAGARRVLISGPSQTAELTVVLGANEERIGAQRLISNASCTTNTGPAGQG